MKIHRLRLRHYRGVALREVEFAPSGVTIVQGPNEVGKSSLAEALELLLEEYDQTTKQRIREIQPADRDEGSEVEAELEIGSARLRYGKRFHKRPATWLSIDEPRVENWTGREAHERVRALLEAHVDTALWRALRIVQGDPLVQPALGDAPSLIAALDRAAGVGSGGEREQSLFDRVREAWEEHFTPTGRPRRERVAAERAVEETRADEQKLRVALEALERDVEDDAALRRRVAELEARVARGREALRAVDAELDALHALRERVERLEALRDAACAEEREALQAARQRNQLATQEVGVEAEVESLAEELESEAPATIAAAAELRHVEERLAEERAAGESAVEVVRRAKRDAALRRGERELTALRERAERVAREQDEADRARSVLSGPEIDDAVVTEIQQLQLQVERAEARLAAEGPTVQIAPQVDLEIYVDGRRERLEAGSAASHRVAEALTLSLPDIGEIRVVAGAGVAERRKALEHARTRLRVRCIEVGVDDHAGAVAALSERRAAREELARSERRLAEALGKGSPRALEERLAKLAGRVESYRQQQRDDEAPATLEAAESALDRAESELARIRERVEDLSRRRDESARHFERRDRHRGETHTRLELAERTRIDLGQRLAAARAERPDADLERVRDERVATARASEARAREAKRELSERQPEQIEARAATQRDALAADERALREQRDALLRTTERLELAGAQGLFERSEAAARRRTGVERELAARTRRANAAQRLFDALREERDAARSHYAAPLAEHIARLGRPLFGPDFDVELDDDLQVSRRIRAGTNLSVRQLSAGAREQLALLSRLAAARIAGDVPLWLDDALGHSDPSRLEALGPLLASAGEGAQVIVLTCSPERFRSVPDARVVELD